MYTKVSTVYIIMSSGGTEQILRADDKEKNEFDAVIEEDGDEIFSSDISELEKINLFEDYAPEWLRNERVSSWIPLGNLT